MSGLVPHFAFSFSKYKAFRECPRRYWLSSIGSWEGWEPSAPPRAQLLYRLSKMENLITLAGKLVHSELREAVQDRDLSVNRAVSEANGRLTKAWRDSKSRRWAERPIPYRRHPAGIYTSLAEHYYPGWDRDVSGTGRRMRTRVDSTIRRAFDCGEIEEAHASDRILALEDLPKSRNRPALEVGGVPVWVRLDLAYSRVSPTSTRRPPGLLASLADCVIVDWKSGRPQPEADGAQVALYSKFAVSCWMKRPEDVETRLVYLGTDPQRVDVARADPAALAALDEAIPAAAAEITSRLDDPALNLGPEEAFERTEDLSKCRRCPMFHGCKGHRNLDAPEKIVQPEWRTEL